MNRLLFAFVIICVPFGIAPVHAADAKPIVVEKYGQLPLSFERISNSEYVAHGQGYTIDLQDTGARLLMNGSSAIGMEFVNGRRTPAISGNPLPGKVNYIHGNDPRQWRLGLPTYGRVAYKGIYPGVDVVYYGNQRQLEFDVALQPGADLSAVHMRFKGGKKPRVDDQGDLVLGDLRLKPPAVTQGKKSVAASYALLTNGDVGFKVAAYDRNQPLLIDPTIVYSTLLGAGTSSTFGQGIALDSSGNAYVTGYTFAADFPVVNAAFAGFAGNYDGIISKINSTGTALIYSTYFGGSNNDIFQGIAIDSTGAAWVAGYTLSSNFPLMNPAKNTYSGTGNNGVVVKLNANGGLVFSSYLGGSGTNAYAVAVDPSGNAYVTGSTGSAFQASPGAYQTLNQGNNDAFVTKYTSGGGVPAYSTFLGGANDDFGYGIAADSSGNAFVAGNTCSTSFPGAPGGGAQPTSAGGCDAFIAKVGASGSALSYFTFLGGSLADSAYAIALDPSGNAYVGGSTSSINLPVTIGAAQTANAGGPDGFAAKLNSTGTAFSYVTYLGGERQDSLRGLAYDPSSGGVYVTGYTESGLFPAVSAVQASLPLNSASIFQTLNSGTSWSAFGTNIPGAAKFLTADPSTPGVMVVSTDAGASRTANNGTTWTAPFNFGGTSAAALSRSPANPSVIYAMTAGNSYLSTDGGVSWSFKGYAGTSLLNVVADPLTATTAYAYFPGAGVYVTTNSGATWTAANSGLPSTQVYDMVAASDGSLYVHVYVSGVYKSVNQSASWTAANMGLPSPLLVTAPLGTSNHILAISPSNPSVLYLSAGIMFKTTNGGASWAATTGFVANGAQYVAVTPQSSSVLYAVTSNPQNVYLSADGGSTWNLAAAGLSSAFINGFAFDPTNASRAFVFTNVPYNAFVAKINSAGTALTYSTYLGSPNSTFGYAIATDGTGDAFVTGYGSGIGFPLTAGALYGPSASSSAFVTKISDSTAACSYAISPATSLIPGGGSAMLTYNVVAPSGCSWTASSNQSWATIVAGGSGSGTGVFTVSAAFYGTGPERSATLTVGTGSATLIQAPTSCSYSLSPSSLSVPMAGGTLHFTVNAGAGCDWTLTTDDPFAINIVSGASGTGTGTVTLNVGGNFGKVSRTLSVQSPQAGVVGISQTGTGEGLLFVPVTPCRIVDTRTGMGGFTGPIATGATQNFNPQGSCGIPGTAQAYSLNVAVVPVTTLGFLTAWPAGQARPVAATLNSLDGRIKSSAAIVPAGTGGAISIFASDATHVVLDINGYFLPSTPGALAFYPVTPCRLVDTRNGTLLTGSFATGQTRTLPILSSTCAVPGTAQAYSLNFVAVPPARVGFLTAYPTGVARPVVATLNDVTGTVAANAAIVPAGTGGSIDVFASDATQLVVDINGYYAPPATGGLSLYNLPPCRVLDTRLPSGAPPITGQLDVNVLGSLCGGTPATGAYVFNATVVPTGSLGFLTMWPQGTTRPVVATLNALDGAITNNLAVVPTNNTQVSAFASDSTHLILDLFGYFAP